MSVDYILATSLTDVLPSLCHTFTGLQFCIVHVFARLLLLTVFRMDVL